MATTEQVGSKDAEVLAEGGTKFQTGAVRSADKNHVMYQLISPIGMRRMAETMKEGFDKYGAYNWERGMPIGDLLNHAIAHIYAFLSGVPSVDAKTGKTEDDLAHAAWNLYAAMHMEETHPDLDHGLRAKNKPIPEPETVRDKLVAEEFKKFMEAEQHRHSFLPEKAPVQPYNSNGPWNYARVGTPLQFSHPNPPMVEESRLIALQARFEAFKATSEKEREALCNHISHLTNQIGAE